MVRRLIKGQNGQLIEEAQTIDATQPAPLLTSPLTAQAGGASPDAAKMAGTQANKQSTFRKQIKSGDTLQRYKQTEDQRLQKQLGEADAQYVQTVQAVSNLPTFQKNIQAAALSYAFGRGEGQAVPSFTVRQDVVAKQAAQAGLSIEELNLALNSILAAPGSENVDAWNKIARAVGNKSPADLTWEDFAMFVPEVNDLIEDVATPIFGSNVTLGQLPDLDAKLTESGFRSLDDLASTLGTTPEAVKAMTVDQLNRAMSLLRPAFDDVANLKRLINDPAIGANERTEVRKRLRELGITGVRSLEAKANQILEQVEDGDTLDFMGEQMRIEDILDDDYMSGLITEALTSEETFNKLPPSLQNYIVSNRKALETATAGIKGGLIARKQIIEDNRAVGAGVMDPLMDLLAPGWNDATGGRLDVTKLPKAYYTAKGLNEAQQTAFLSLLRDPRWKEYVQDYTIEDLREIGFLDNPEQTFTELATLDDTLDSFREDALTPAQIQAWMSANLGFNPEDLRTLVQVGGLDADGAAILDANSDGILDYIGDIKTRLVGLFNLGNDPASIASNKRVLDKLRNVGKTATIAQQMKIARAEQLQNTLATSLGKDNILNIDINDIYGNPKWSAWGAKTLLADPYVPEGVKEHLRLLQQGVETNISALQNHSQLQRTIGPILLDLRNYDDQKGWLPLLDKKAEYQRLLANPLISNIVKENLRKSIAVIDSVRTTYQSDSKGGWYDVYVGDTRVMRFHPGRAKILTDHRGGEAATMHPDSNAASVSNKFALGSIKL